MMSAARTTLNVHPALPLAPVVFDHVDVDGDRARTEVPPHSLPTVTIDR